MSLRGQILSSVVASLALVSCASLGAEGGGADNLPNRGIIPYALQDAEELSAETALVLTWATPKDGQFSAPHAMRVDDTVVLFAEWYEEEGQDGVIVRAESTDGLQFTEPKVIFDSSALPTDWSSDRVGAPSVIRLDEMWWMVFEYGQGDGFGLAWSVDGEHFVPYDRPVLVPEGSGEAKGIFSPSLYATTEGGVGVVYEARSSAGIGTLRRASADETMSFSRQGVVLNPGSECLDVQQQPEACWDSEGVGQPDVRVATTASGTSVLRMLYVGIGPSGKRIGFAASFDGAAWSRFELNPVLIHDAPLSHPTHIRLAGRYLLYVSAEAPEGGRGIRVAANDAGSPSEDWE